jgi:hypothetical protein
MSKPTKRKPGRPSFGKSGRRQSFTFRIRKTTRDSLVKAARSSGVSISEEIERRVEQSLRNADVVEAMFGGRQNAQLLFLFSVAMQELKRQAGKPWYEDQPACDALRKVIDDILVQHRARLPSWKTAAGGFSPLADLVRRTDFPFIDHFQIGDAAAFAWAKAQFAAQNAPAKAPEENSPPSSRKTKGK